MSVTAQRKRPRRRGAKRSETRRKSAEMKVIDDALVLLARDHAPATVRQLYYQAVVNFVVPKLEAAYRTISKRLVQLREQGRVPWGAIADRTRSQRKPPTWPSMRSAVASVRHYYRREVWRGLPDRVFVVLEKEALFGIVYEVTEKYDVAVYVLRGFSSVTFIHELASDILDCREYHLRSHVLVLTDLDPSGVVSAASFRDRLAKYCDIPLTDQGRAPDKLPNWLTYTPLAVTRQQAEAYDLPSRPTKTQRNAHAQSSDWDGGSSIELDAFAPNVLRQIVKEAITAYITGSPHVDTARG